jgi:PEP-CTERM motif
VNLFFISDGATPREISNFSILPGLHPLITEDGTLQDVSAFFGMLPGTVLVGSDVPEPSALLLLATGIAGLLGYGWRRR